MLPVESIAFLVAGAVLAGFAMGLVGFGTGLMALGFWLHVIDPKLAAPLVGICSLATTAFTFRAYGHAISLKRLAPFFIGGLIGLPIGVAVLTGIDPARLKVALGLFLVGYALFRLFVFPSLIYGGGGRAADGAVGFGGGILAGIAAIPGPLTIPWCSMRGWSKDEQRAVYQPINQSIVLIAMGLYAWKGMMTAELGRLALLCVPAALGGMWLGIVGYKRLDDAQFERIILWLLLASGVALVILNAFTR